MSKGYTTRTDKGYEIQFYDKRGNSTVVVGCETLEDVAKILISTCNGQLNGVFPTIWLDGELIRNM